MDKKLIVGNWKLNPITQTEAKKITARIKTTKEVNVVICPPHPFLALLKFPLIGAQDSFWNSKGPFTGQVSPATLKSLKIKYCIIGHSEKRNVGETDEQINEKLKELLVFGITPILCVGHGTTVEEDDLEVIEVIKEQLKKALKGVESEKVVVAYEPVWAISGGNPHATKRIATPEHVSRVALFIKTKFSPMGVLYGGSVNASNASQFLHLPQIDGALVGGASLVPGEFNAIVNIAKGVK